MSEQQYPGSRWWKFDFHNTRLSQATLMCPKSPRCNHAIDCWHIRIQRALVKTRIQSCC